MQGNRCEDLRRDLKQAVHAEPCGLQQAGGAQGRLRRSGHRSWLAGEASVCLGPEYGHVEVAVEAKDVVELSLKHVVVAERAVV
jgi:hypothetical protein